MGNKTVKSNEKPVEIKKDKNDLLLNSVNHQLRHNEKSLSNLTNSDSLSLGVDNNLNINDDLNKRINFYPKFLPQHLNDDIEENITIDNIIQAFNDDNYTQITNLCALHILPISKIEEGYILKDTSNSIKLELLYTLNQLELEINTFFKKCYSKFSNFSFLKLNINQLKSLINESSEEISQFELNITGFESKLFFSNNKQIVIINSDNLLLKKGYVFAIKFDKNGKTFMGKISIKTLLFNWLGMYISKSNNIISGIFDNNGEIKQGNCINIKSLIFYEGYFNKFKKEGNGIETNKNYTFKGMFEKGRKVSGEYTKLASTSNKFKFHKITVEKGNQTTFEIILTDYINNDKRKIVLKGNVKNNDINDENCIAFFNFPDDFPVFEGEVKESIKEGKAKYFWNKNFSTETSFENNFLNGKSVLFINNKAIDVEFNKNEIRIIN